MRENISIFLLSSKIHTVESLPVPYSPTRAFFTPL